MDSIKQTLSFIHNYITLTIPWKTIHCIIYRLSVNLLITLMIQIYITAGTLNNMVIIWPISQIYKIFEIQYASNVRLTVLMYLMK